MNDGWLRTLLREQQGSGFADLAGAEGALTLPVSDRLVSRLIAQRLPASSALRELSLHAQGQDGFVVRLRLARPSFLPAFTIRVAIVRQPILPASPWLEFHVVSQGVAALAGPLLRFLDTLPPWARMDGEILRVDVRHLLEQQQAGHLLAYLTDLRLTTAPGHFVLRLKAGLPPPP